MTPLPVTVVCFCDIPSDDLYLHMSKYGRFGISFTKTFLLSRGANPVYYVARDSRAILSQEQPGEDLGVLFRRELNDLVESDPNFRPPASADAVEYGKAIRRFRFLRNHVIACVKPYDVLGVDGAPRPDDDPNNFYMEREWRVLGRVEFALSDVVRITLPRRFASRFRSDFPDYQGQLTLADSWVVRMREAALGIRRAARRALRGASGRTHEA